MNPLHRDLSCIALTLGLLAAIVGETPQAPLPVTCARPEIDQLVGEIDDELDHVAAIDVARWIRDQRPNLEVLDLRSADEASDDRIPGAKLAALASLSSLHLMPDATIVLYSTTGIHAAQAWVVLRAKGYKRVYFLHGGWQAWQREIMQPTLAVDASPAAIQTYNEAVALSRYFGGDPQRSVAATNETTLSLPRRRGC